MNKKMMRISLIPVLVSVIVVICGMIGMISAFSEAGKVAEMEPFAHRISIPVGVILIGFVIGGAGVCMVLVSFFLKDKSKPLQD